MSAAQALALGTGLVLGLGLWLVFVRLPVMRRTTFAQRVEPQLRSVASQSRLLEAEAARGALFGPLERISRVVMGDAVRRLARFNVSTAGLAARLQQAGRAQSALEFRAVQLVWAAGGFVLGLLLVLFSAAAGRLNVFGAIALALGLTLCGFLLRDHLLGVEIRRRQAAMLAEFPALAELMALAVAAGESATGALERVCRQSHGELSREFTMVLAQTRSGTPLVEALTDFARRVRVPALVRFVDGLGVAVNRGTPLADVLRAQAQDVRDVGKRELMESAGRKEIAMMVPLVFGILPLTVIFAVFPGIAVLELGF
ncbi:type II secretion system F family protein [Specibacter cremeus]|uniref:type II secretion system F family protein n=1 Tax=Specibacter cremeus TaxID=1629051 RepID=UPI000F776C7A|nr:type II secretion system F family protein [Specibacter cremeus]